MLRFVSILLFLGAHIVPVNAAPNNMRLCTFTVDDYNLTGGAGCLDPEDAVIFPYWRYRTSMFGTWGSYYLGSIMTHRHHYANATCTKVNVNGSNRKSSAMVMFAGHGTYFDYSCPVNPPPYGTGVGWLMGCGADYGIASPRWQNGALNIYGFSCANTSNRWIVSFACKMLQGTWSWMQDQWTEVMKGPHVVLGYRSNADHYHSDDYQTSISAYSAEAQRFWENWVSNNRTIWTAWILSQRENPVPGAQIGALWGKHPNCPCTSYLENGYPCTSAEQYIYKTYQQDDNTPAVSGQVWSLSLYTFGTPEW